MPPSVIGEAVFQGCPLVPKFNNHQVVCEDISSMLDVSSCQSGSIGYD